MRPRAGAANGFTLVELMVTVGLLAFLGIVAASTFDSKSWLAHYRLKAAVRNLEMNFQYRQDGGRKKEYVLHYHLSSGARWGNLRLCRLCQMTQQPSDKEI